MAEAAMVGAPAFPLRGRDQSLGDIGKRLEGVRNGAGFVLVVEGRAGVGKSRLLQECASIASELSFRVGLGVAEPGRNLVDIEALLDALFGGESPLLDRNALSDVHASPEQRFWLLQDIQSLIEEAALKNPLLICLDDLHWAGSGCADAMRTLPQQLASVPVAWVMAFRPNQGSPEVQSAKSYLVESHAAVLRLGPLENRAIAEIAADILGAKPDDGLLQKAEMVHGNPFLLVEFFRGLLEDGIVTVEAGEARLLEDRLPHRIADSMEIRLSRTSSAAQRVATVAASLGRRFSVSDLAAMSGMSLTDLLQPVSELTQADIFSPSADRLAFGHDLIRDAVRASAPLAVRRALDRQAAGVLIGQGALPVEVATQLAESADPGDEVAISTLLKAAEGLGPGDPAASAELARRALDLAPPGHELRGQLVARRALSMFAAGSGEEAKAFADRALRQNLPAEQEAQVRLSIASMFRISPDVRADNCRQALALPDLTTDLRAALWASLFHNLVVAGRTEEALQLRQSVRTGVMASTSGAGRYALQLAESALEYEVSDFGGALRALDAADRFAIPGQEDARQRLFQHYRGWVLSVLDRFDDALQVAEDGIATAQRDRQNWAIRLFETWKGRQLLQMGRLVDAAAVLEGRFTVSEASSAGVTDAHCVTALGQILVHLGDERGARETAEISKGMLEASAPIVRHHAAWHLAFHAMATEGPEQARKWLDAGGENSASAVFPHFPLEAADSPQCVRIAVAVGDHELADGVVKTMARCEELNPTVRSLRAAAMHCRGLARRSIEDLETAVELFGDGLRPLALGSALEDLGSAKVSEGGHDEAISSLDRALVIYLEIGAAWDAARVRRGLRSLGVRRRVTSTARPAVGWDALSDAELRVVRLAVDGHTNREIARKLFVSPHTVNTHLRHVFDKLEIKSRVELTRLAERANLASVSG